MRSLSRAILSLPAHAATAVAVPRVAAFTCFDDLTIRTIHPERYLGGKQP